MHFSRIGRVMKTVDGKPVEVCQYEFLGYLDEQVTFYIDRNGEIVEVDGEDALSYQNQMILKASTKKDEWVF